MLLRRELATALITISALCSQVGISVNLLSQTTALLQPPVGSTLSVARTLSLGEAAQTVKLEIDDPEMKYQNGFFISADKHGRVRIRTKDGDSREILLRPEAKNVLEGMTALHDAAVYRDGSIVASFTYMMSHDNRRYYSLIHYDPAGNFLEQMDLGISTAHKICIAEDQSIWALSSDAELGHDVYRPSEGVLRNYKFGAGLQQAVAPRSSFPRESNRYAFVNSAIDCSGKSVHALTGDGQWIEFIPGGDAVIMKVESPNRSEFGDSWLLSGFAYLDTGHAYGVVKSEPGSSFKRMLAQLIPSKDGETLHWIELPPDKVLPINSQLSDKAPRSGDGATQLVTITNIMGVDHENGEQLVYRISTDETVLWSTPVFKSAGN